MIKTGNIYAGLGGSTTMGLLTASNGLTAVGTDVQLGGVLTTDLSIDMSAVSNVSFDDGSGDFLNFFIGATPPTVELQAAESTTGPHSLVSLQGGDLAYLEVTAATAGQYGRITVASTGDIITLTDTINHKGAVYFADYSANFTDNSLVSKKYVDSLNVISPQVVKANEAGALSTNQLLDVYTNLSGTGQLIVINGWLAANTNTGAYDIILKIDGVDAAGVNFAENICEIAASSSPISQLSSTAYTVYLAPGGQILVNFEVSSGTVIAQAAWSIMQMRLPV